MINLARIENIVSKLPWERRADELERVQREICSLEVYRLLRVSSAAELDICRIMTLREVRPKEFVLRQGDVGDSFNVRPHVRRRARSCGAERSLSCAAARIDPC
jgi:hypothetical protein